LVGERSLNGDRPQFPTETEIYILPDGEVVFADLPAELAELAIVLGARQPCAVEPDGLQGEGRVAESSLG
jgi:hypothetical protein